MGSAIVDNKGQVLVSVGWQDICTKFHRCHPDTLKNCLESDTVLARGAEAGSFKTYLCKNGMVDMASPIVVSDRHMGAIYLGQFMFTDEELDVERFRRQARQYGFDEQDYLDALRRVPRYSREQALEVMGYYSRLGDMIATLGFSNLSLANTLIERQRAEAELQEKTGLLQNITDHMFDLVALTDLEGVFTYAGPSHRILGFEPEQLMGTSVFEYVHPEDLGRIADEFGRFLTIRLLILPERWSTASAARMGPICGWKPWGKSCSMMKDPLPRCFSSRISLSGNRRSRRCRRATGGWKLSCR